VSQKNVEIVRRLLAEFAETQAFSDLTSPDLVWHIGSWSAWSGQPEYHGEAGFMEFFADWTDAYDDWTQEVEELIDAGDRQVVATTRQRGRLRGSDASVDLRAAFLYTVADGLLVRVDVYGSAEEALRAAALSEPASGSGDPPTR
jgi:ketosteroid isomerase-like protein